MTIRASLIEEEEEEEDASSRQKYSQFLTLNS